MSAIQKFVIYFFLTLFFSCQNREETTIDKVQEQNEVKGPYLLILGTLQDGGSPHAGCIKTCCKNLFEEPDVSRQVVSLGIIDPINQLTYLIEASPDLARQLKSLQQTSGFKTTDLPDGIFLSHAHIGHYAGLMYLGKEVMNSLEVPVYALPRMKSYLETNGPWSQLVNLKNISLKEMEFEKQIQLSNQLKIKSIQVPHRDEYSETAGFVIEGPNKRVLFIPDIDKWEKWEKKIEDEIQKVDVAFIDGTFYDGTEINNRDISEVPHPFVIESMERFKNLDVVQKNKIYFIHLNHTNPLLDSSSEASHMVLKNGFHIVKRGKVIQL